MEDILDLERYPIDQPESAAFKRLTEKSRQQMSQQGALELPGFLSAASLRQLVDFAAQVKMDGHRMAGMYTAYSDNLNDGDNPDLPADHPDRIRLPASHRFIPGDLIGADNPLRRIYEYPPFIEYLRRALEVAQLHPIADELGRINLLTYEPGDCNGWHFDTNEFIVSLVLQTAETGGEYHYIPGLRSDDDPNLAAVSRRMQNPDAAEGVRQVDLKAGSLFLFKGKYTLHRVTEIDAARDRIVAIMSYHQSPGHRLSDSSKIAMYGRRK